MRRWVTMCALGALAAGAWALAGRTSDAHANARAQAPAAARKAATANTSAGASSAHPLIVVAQGFDVRALALDAKAQLYVTSAGSPNRIFSLATNNSAQPSAQVTSQAVTTAAKPSALVAIAGTGVAGSLGDGGAAASAQFDFAPDALAARSGFLLAPDGTVYVADTQNSTVRAIAGASSTEPGVIRSIAGRWAARQNVTLTSPIALALDRAGDLFIADQGAGAIDWITAVSTQLESLAHVAGVATLAVTPDGTKLFAASPSSGGVFAIDTATRAIATVAGFAPAQTSESNAGPCANLASNSGSESTPIPCPAGLALDPNGNLFVADAANGKILRVDAQTSAVTTALDSLAAPGAIAFDAKGDLFIADQSAREVVEAAGLVSSLTNLTFSTPAPFAAPCPQTTSPFTFCNMPQGGTSQTATFVLTNNTTAAVTSLVVALSPASPANFAIKSNSCVSTLAAGASCNVGVAFTPTASGALTAALTATDAASDSASANLAGTGDNFSLQLASSTPTQITVQQGGTATYGAQIVADNVFGSEGEKVTFACPATSSLPVNVSCAVTPCPASVTAGAATNFSIAIVTSSRNSVAPVPPSGACSSYGPAPGTAMLLAPPASPSAPFSRGPAPDSRHRLELLFAAALLLCACGVRRLKWIGAVALVALLAAGCHKSKAPDPSTPTGTYAFSIIGTATDAHGNSLGASREVQINLNVIAAGSVPSQPF